MDLSYVFATRRETGKEKSAKTINGMIKVKQKTEISTAKIEYMSLRQTDQILPTR